MIKEDIVKNVKQRSTWQRILYMLLFGIAYSVAEVILIAVVVSQLFFKLFTGTLNEKLLKFGKQLSCYVYQIFLYMTFNEDDLPFPFSDFPNENTPIR